MGRIAVLGVFVADAVFRAERMPRIGETLLGTGFQLGPGGKGSNQAVAAGLQGAGVDMITRLGRDTFADMALGVWARAGVTPHVTQDPDSYTGAAQIFVDAATGDNAIIVAPGAASDLGPADIDANRAVIEGAAVFITQLEQPLDAARAGLAMARAAGVATLLNPAPGQALDDDMLALCDYITPNETETQDITGILPQDDASIARAAEALKARGVRCPLITLGARGVFLDGHGILPARAAGAVVDTTGAGDAFNAGFAVGLARGDSAERAARRGIITAGISITRHGAAAAMPTADEVQKGLEDAGWV